jgi:pyocin large subunit-like protein
MSIAALDWAFKASVATSSQKLVLICLANYADASGVMYPSVERIALDAQMNRKTVLAAMAALMAQGILIDTGKRIGRTKSVRILQLVPYASSTEFGTASKQAVRNTTVSGPKNGTAKQYQKRDTEPKAFDPLINQKLLATQGSQSNVTSDAVRLAIEGCAVGLRIQLDRFRPKP